MSDIFQIANIGMVQGRERLEAIGLNAASASLPGYRRHVVTGSVFDAALAAAEPPSTGAQPRAAIQHIDLKPGAMTSTGRALDLFIDSEDLFFALTDGIQTWLTRAGSFQVNEEGVLVGEGGLRVVGAQGDLQLGGSDVEISTDGQITRNGVVVGALQLFQPLDPTSLEAAQGALLIAPGGMQPASPESARVHSGALEAANTDPNREMLGLMTLSRQFESLSRVVQSYDEALGRAIQKLGEG